MVTQAYVPHSRTPDIYEILEKANHAESKEAAVAVLRKFNSKSLRNIVAAGLDQNIIFDLPQGEVPYEPNQGHNAPTNLHKESVNLPYLVHCNKRIRNDGKRENLFIGMLEGVNPNDAKLLLKIKDNVFPYSIPHDVIRTVWPDLIGKFPQAAVA